LVGSLLLAKGRIYQGCEARAIRNGAPQSGDGYRVLWEGGGLVGLI
jgi:hypothetical protein